MIPILMCPLAKTGACPTCPRDKRLIWPAKVAGEWEACGAWFRKDFGDRVMASPQQIEGWSKEPAAWAPQGATK
jgi:hypothetical protein